MVSSRAIYCRVRRLHVVCRIKRRIEGGRGTAPREIVSSPVPSSFYEARARRKHPVEARDRKKGYQRTKGRIGMRERRRRLLSGSGRTASRTVADIEWRKGKDSIASSYKNEKEEQGRRSVRVVL